MSSCQKSGWYCVTACLVLVCLVVLGGRAEERQGEARTASSGKLRELREERYETLKTVVEAEKRLVEIGQGSPRELAKATTAMLRAEADLRPAGSERIEIHEKIVTTLRECERLIAREADRGLVSSADVMKVRLRRLKAQMKIEKMKLAQQTSQ